MWKTPEGIRYFSGSMAHLLAEGIMFCLSEMEDLGFEYRTGFVAWDDQTYEQRVAAIHVIAFSLLKGDTVPPKLTACLESGIAAVFSHLERLLYLECNNPFEEAEPFLLRSLVRKSLKQMDLDPEIQVTCEQSDLWREELEFLSDCILWDDDYALGQAPDLPPEQGKGVHYVLGIDGEYFTAIMPDPNADEAEKLRLEVMKLCESLIE
jgi:hypothetical protein